MMAGSRSTTGQLIRYGMVGMASNLSAYLVYLLITHWGVGHKAAMTLVYVAGATIGFFGNRQWAFAHQGEMRSAMFRYCIAHLLGYLLNFFILATFVDHLGYAHEYVQAAAIIVVAGFLFVVFKRYVFRQASPLQSK